MRADPFSEYNLSKHYGGSIGPLQGMVKGARPGDNIKHISGHGILNGSAVRDNRTGGGNRALTAKQAVAEIGNVISPGDTVVLYICNSGSGTFGSEFAKESGCMVLAPNGIVTPSGKVYASKEDLKNGKEMPRGQRWTTYGPDGKEIGGCGR